MVRHGGLAVLFKRLRWLFRRHGNLCWMERGKSQAPFALICSLSIGEGQRAMAKRITILHSSENILKQQIQIQWKSFPSLDVGSSTSEWCHTSMSFFVFNLCDPVSAPFHHRCNICCVGGISHNNVWITSIRRISLFRDNVGGNPNN